MNTPRSFSWSVSSNVCNNCTWSNFQCSSNFWWIYFKMTGYFKQIISIFSPTMLDKFNLRWFLPVSQDGHFKMFSNHGGQFTMIFTQLRLKYPQICSALPGGCDYTPLWARKTLNRIPSMQAYGLFSIPNVPYPHASALHSNDYNFTLSTVNFISGSAQKSFPNIF